MLWILKKVRLFNLSNGGNVNFNYLKNCLINKSKNILIDLPFIYLNGIEEYVNVKKYQ